MWWWRLSVWTTVHHLSESENEPVIRSGYSNVRRGTTPVGHVWIRVVKPSQLAAQLRDADAMLGRVCLILHPPMLARRPPAHAVWGARAGSRTAYGGARTEHAAGHDCLAGDLQRGGPLQRLGLAQASPQVVRPSGRMAASESSEYAEMCASVGTVSGPLMFRFAPVLRWLLEPLLRRRLPDEIR
jgi:hypothetical protein